MIRSLALVVAAFAMMCPVTQVWSERPNVVWIIPDDMSANFSCYGETAITTPHVDQLAAEGTKFTRAFVTAPVCSTCRSALITGMYQTSIGAQHHRSGRGDAKITLPDGIELVPKLFQNAGYYTTISDWPAGGRRLGKTDYNFQWDESIYDGTDWSKRKNGQPFFAQIQIPGGKLRGTDSKGWEKVAAMAETVLGSHTSIDQVQLPPYYPDHPDLLRDWAAYLDSVRLTDHRVGEVIERLRREGILESTLIVFMTDHGISHARGKQFLYDEGIHVPMVIRGPGLHAGLIRNDLVEHIDIAALSLAAAGIPIPTSMQAVDILAMDYQPRHAVFAARDRCDETVDHIRSVRSEQFKYIRNFLPNRPYLQPCAYKDAKQILIAMREWHALGRLNEVQLLHFRDIRPVEELYDLRADPHEINNLADNPDFEATLIDLRAKLDDWMVHTGDQGRTPEAMSMYDSDMTIYVNSLRGRHRDLGHLDGLNSNIELMKQWAAQGK